MEPVPELENTKGEIISGEAFFKLIHFRYIVLLLFTSLLLLKKNFRKWQLKGHEQINRDILEENVV